MHHVVIALAVLSSLAIAACCGAPPPPPAEPPTPEPVAEKPAPPPVPAMLENPPIWNSAADVEEACREALDAARSIREYLADPLTERTREGTLVPMSDLFVFVDRVMPLSDLMANVHPDKAVRDAAEKCQQEAAKLLSEVKLDPRLYAAIQAVPDEGLDDLDRRSRDHLLRDYRRAGVDRDEETRTALARLNEEMVKTGQDFSRTIREDKRSIEIADASGLAGMPEDFVALHAPGADGKIRVTTDYPDFFPFESYSPNEPLRRALYVEFLDRGHPQNGPTLAKLLGQRWEFAKRLGYSSWAAHAAEDKMVKTDQAIEEFIERVAAIARPRMQKDLADLAARKKAEVKEARRAKRKRAPIVPVVEDPNTIHVWDRFYYVERVRAERFGVDARKVREYFEFGRVKEGLLALSADLFGLEFRRVEGAPAWHPSVEVYDLHSGEDRIGRVYFDMHPREGKYGHAAMFQAITGVAERQLPSAAMVCNFPDPARGPALMEHKDVVTFFHEFGHLLHHMLSGKHRQANLAGLACEWDFVEAPSQLMEEWAWEPAVLARFAKHTKTGETIPADLVERMRQAEEFGKGVTVMRQLFYAALSLAYHRSDPAGFEPETLLAEMQKRYSPYPLEPGTHEHEGFGHLEGYSSMYYTYMWSLVLAKDLAGRFREKGFLDRETAVAYRSAVLETGGTVDADEMVKRFLGRESSFDAFRAWLEAR